MKPESKPRWYKKKPKDKIWWKDIPNQIGTLVFSFDKEKEFYLFRDYPWKLTKEQKEVFDKDNPYWAHFFRDRTQEQSGKEGDA